MIGSYPKYPVFISHRGLAWRVLTGAVFFALAANSVQATPIFTGTPVGDNATADNSTLTPQTGHGVAVGSDGTIYALYVSASTGLRVARSVDRGEHFLPSVAVNPAGNAGSIAVSSLGKVYVVFEDAGQLEVSISADSGQTFSSPVILGAASNLGTHVATDGHFVYIIDGGSAFTSSDDGQTFAPTTYAFAFSDVHVDSVNGDVVYSFDNPQVTYVVSTDHGATVGALQSPNAQTYYSASGLASTPGGTLLVVAGSLLGSGGTNDGFVIDVADAGTTTTQQPFGNAAIQSRQVVADHCGNIIDAYDDGTGSAFHVSNNLGFSFGTVYAELTSTNGHVAISPVRGDVTALYTLDNEIFLDVHADLLGTCYPFSALTLTVSDGTPYAQYGQTLTYLATLANTGTGPATNLAVTSAASAALDGANATWTCVATGGATCNAGSGVFQDTVTLPLSSSISWLISVPGVASSTDGTAEFDISAPGADTVSDVDTLVLFRNGFDGNAAKMKMRAPRNR